MASLPNQLVYIRRMVRFIVFSWIKYGSRFSVKKTFPEVKWAFFQKKLFSEFLSVDENHPEYKNQQVFPQLKLMLEFTDDVSDILSVLQHHFEYLQKSVYNIGTHYFTKKRLDEELQMFIPDEEFRSRFSDLVLNIFSHQFGEKKHMTIWKWVYRNEEKEYLTDFADFYKCKRTDIKYHTLLNNFWAKIHIPIYCSKR